MTEIMCGYSGDREAALVASLYDDGDPALRAAFEAHLTGCGRCRDELDALRGVRVQLGRWAPPEPSFAAFASHSARHTPQSWWQGVPAWAQVAAAVLLLGVSAGIANLDVRYDANGLSVRTGWSNKQPPAPAAGVARGDGASAPWRPDLTALERQLKTEFRAAQVSVTQASVATVAPTPRAASAADADVLRRVRALLDESEKRQQRELALRVAEVVRDVNAQRQADLVKIDRSLGVVQNNLGVEVMKQRQSLNLLYRASQRQ
jgi:hypothetical protein